MENVNYTDELVQPGRLNDAEVLAKLRSLLLGRLRGAFSNHPRVDEAFLEDVVQDSLIRIIERIDQFQGRSKFLTWATTIAIREAYGQLRKREWKNVSLEQILDSEPSLHSQLIDRKLKPDEQWERSSQVKLLEEVLRSELTAKQQKALLAELKGMPLAEIAREMGSSRNAIYKLTHDARKRLKRKIEERGIAIEELL